MFIYRLISALIIGTYILSPAVVDSWTYSDQSWFRPFVIWLFFILIAAWLEGRRNHDEF